MAVLTDIVAFLNRELRIAEIADYGGAINGLQLENDGRVSKVVAAVDASLPVVRKAIAAGADLLVVHHGMFWQGAQPLTGAFYQKIREAMQANLAIYSAHLPLDVHPQWGNNALLAAAIGMTPTGTFLPYKGQNVGLTGEISIHRDELRARLEAAVGGDRKSTRLNSSHITISYAVFCLTKKTPHHSVIHESHTHSSSV